MPDIFPAPHENERNTNGNNTFPPGTPFSRDLTGGASEYGMGPHVPKVCHRPVTVPWNCTRMAHLNNSVGQE